MHFVCDKETLVNSVSPALYAVSAKSTITALEGLLVTADKNNGSVVICGYDLEKGVRVTISGDNVRIFESGSLIVNATKFALIIKNLPDGNITLQSDDKYILSISCGKSEFSINASESSAYPAIPDLNGEKSFKMDQGALKKMIGGVLFAVAQNNSRPVLNGALFEIQDSLIKIVGVDGFRMALRRESGKISLKDREVYEGSLYLKFIIPGKSLSELMRLLKDGGGVIEIELSRKHIVFSIDNIIFFSRLIEGEFVDYNKTIPADYVTKVKINTKDFIGSVERASLIMDDKQKSYVKLSFVSEGGGYSSLHVSSATALGKVYDECAIEMEGGNMDIAFNHRYLIDALRVVDKESVTLRMDGATRPMVIISDDAADTVDPDFLYLVVPIRMKE